MKKIFVFQSSASAIGSLPYFPLEWEKIPYSVERNNDVYFVNFNLSGIFHDIESDCMVTRDEMLFQFTHDDENAKTYGTFENYLDACMTRNNGSLENPLEYMRGLCADYMRDMYYEYIALK